MQRATWYDRGRWIARADMACGTRRRSIVEYDGAVHLTEERRRSDAARRNLLQAAGWYVIVLTARDLKHPEATVHSSEAALIRGRAPPSSSRPLPR